MVWSKYVGRIIKRISLVSMIYSACVLSSVSADMSKKVLQVDASLSIAQQIEFQKAPFVLLEGEPSTLAEEGLGGHKVELIAKINKDQGYTLFSKIYNYTKDGYILLGTPSIHLEYQSLGLIEFESKTAGTVMLQLEIVKEAEVSAEALEFSQMIR